MRREIKQDTRKSVKDQKSIAMPAMHRRNASLSENKEKEISRCSSLDADKFNLRAGLDDPSFFRKVRTEGYDGHDIRVGGLMRAGQVWLSL